MNAPDYFSKFIAEYGITDNVNSICLNPDSDTYETKEYQYFSVSNRTNYEGISILYPSLDNNQYTIRKNSNKKGLPVSDSQTFSRICLMNREPQPDGSIKKYHSPKKAKTIYEDGKEVENDESLMFPFWTPKLIENFQAKTKTPTLGMVEGEKKAFKAYMNGMPMLGLGSKDGFATSGAIKQLHSDIIRFIDTCEVENLILVLDADTLEVKPEHLQSKTDLTKRAYSFYNTVNNYRTIVTDLMRKCSTLKSAYFMHLLPDFSEKAKGLDDLLIQYPKNGTNILHDFLQFDRAETYFAGIDVIKAKDTEIRDYFGLGIYDHWSKEVNAFYEVYKASIKKQDFVFKKYQYFFDTDSGRYERKQESISNGIVTYNLREFETKVFLGKNTTVKVTEGFLIFIKYLTIDENERNTWVLEVRRPDQPELYLEVPHDDFHDSKRMEKLFSSKRLALTLTETSLKEIRNFLLTHPETMFKDANKILRYGLHEETELFFMGNVAITKTGELLKPDDFGIITYKNFNLSMPQIGKNKQPLYFYTENDIDFNRWYMLLKDAQREEMTFIAVSWLLNTIFRDLAIKYKGFSPILFITGIAGTAKSTIFRHMNYLFAPDIKELEMNIKGKNTNAAFTAKVEQRTNGYLFADEYYPAHPLEDAFQASYDNKAYSKMDMGKGGLETLDLIPKTSIGLASNFKPQLPQSEPLFTRMVMLTNNVRTFSETRKKAYAELQVVQERGLSCILRDVWKHRELINQNYLMAYQKLIKAIESKTSSEKDMPSRLLSNLAVILTPSFILHTHGKIQICEYSEEREVLKFFAEQAHHSIMSSWRMMRDKSTLREFFEIIQDLFDKGQLIGEFHYRFIKNEDTILLNTRKLYSKYADEYRRITRFELMPPVRSDIEDEIMTWAGFESTDEVARKTFFSKQRMKLSESVDAAESEGQNGCCKVSYSKLVQDYGIDFHKARWDKTNN